MSDSLLTPVHPHIFGESDKKQVLFPWIINNLAGTKKKKKYILLQSFNKS